MISIAAFTSYHNNKLQDLQDCLMTSNQQDLSMIAVKLASLNR